MLTVFLCLEFALYFQMVLLEIIVFQKEQYQFPKIQMEQLILKLEK
nr:MAG TPA: hypothetical protein [Caudoviricetes sp.]